MSEVLSSWFGQETGYSMSVISIRCGLTLLHFLWQGAIIGLLAFAAAKLLRNHSATIHYGLHAVALLACPLSVAVTFAMVEVPRGLEKSSQSDSLAVVESTTAVENGPSDLRDVPYPELKPGVSSASPEHATVIPLTNPTNVAAGSASIFSSEFTSKWLPVIARWMTMIYVAGVCCFLLRLTVALRGGQRLRAILQAVSDSALLALIQSQAQRIGLKFVSMFAHCERIAVPTVIGVLRPMILLPATLTTGLSTDELSAILSHELAHIRR